MNRVFNGRADHRHYFNTSVFPGPLLYYNRFSSSSPATVFMISAFDSAIVGICLEGLFYGKISVLCPYTLAKEVQLFPGLGLYSGIFAIYLRLQRPMDKSRTAIILFYIVCLLYFLSIATITSDVVTFVLEVSNTGNSIYKDFIFYYMLCRHV